MEDNSRMEVAMKGGVGEAFQTTEQRTTIIISEQFGQVCWTKARRASCRCCREKGCYLHASSKAVIEGIPESLVDCCLT